MEDLILVSNKVELRGVANKTSSKGKVYQMLNVEDTQGTPLAFYVPDVSIIPQGLKKGDMLKLTFVCRTYRCNNEFHLRKIEKWS